VLGFDPLVERGGFSMESFGQGVANGLLGRGAGASVHVAHHDPPVVSQSSAVVNSALLDAPSQERVDEALTLGFAVAAMHMSHRGKGMFEVFEIIVGIAPD
jgi:hypothetical protein